MGQTIVDQHYIVGWKPTSNRRVQTSPHSLLVGIPYSIIGTLGSDTPPLGQGQVVNRLTSIISDCPRSQERFSPHARNMNVRLQDICKIVIMCYISSRSRKSTFTDYRVWSSRYNLRVNHFVLKICGSGFLLRKDSTGGVLMKSILRKFNPFQKKRIKICLCRFADEKDTSKSFHAKWEDKFLRWVFNISHNNCM